MGGERGRRTSLLSVLSGILVVALLIVGCGGPDGSGGPSGAAPTDFNSSADGSAPTASSSSTAGGIGGDLARVGGADLEVASYPVEDALAAEGGDAIDSMLSALEMDPSDVELTLAVAPGGDPTISDWRMPGASADAILEAWGASAPGTWTSSSLDGVPALTGNGPDGSSAWVLAADGRFVYVRSDDQAIADEVARLIGS